MLLPLEVLLPECLLLLLPDLLPLFIILPPEPLPLPDWLPTLPPDDEPVVPEPTVEPLLRPVLPDVPVRPEPLPDVLPEPDWPLPDPD